MLKKLRAAVHLVAVINACSLVGMSRTNNSRQAITAVETAVWQLLGLAMSRL